MASDIIWTNHLEERLNQRGISRNEAFDTIRHPDKSLRQGGDKYKLIKNFGYKTVTVVAVFRQNQWIIFTAWSKLPGQKNTYWQGKKDPLITRLVHALIVKIAKFITGLLNRR